MTTFRPRYLYMQSSVGTSSGDPTRHYYYSSLATNGWEWYADTRIATMQSLAAANSLPDGFVLMLPGGMTGDGHTQTHGLETDADPLTGSDACITALTRLRDECISLNMSRGLIIYTGPGTLGGDHTQLAPLAALNVPIIMDGGGSAAQALLEEYDTACGQTVGIESAANNDADPSAYARMSLTIDGPGALWDSQTYTGGLGGSIRPIDFETLDNFTGEWMSFATGGSTRTDIVRRARKVFHELKMSVCSAQQNWENGNILRSDFYENLSVHTGADSYFVQMEPQTYCDATAPVMP
jgi:hypothetical protein